MVYSANWLIICYPPPIKGTKNNHWEESQSINQSMRFAMNSSMGCLLWNYPNGSNLPPRCLLLRTAIAMAPSWWLPCVGWRPVWSRTGANSGRLWALRRCGKGGQRNVASCEGLPKGLHICICLYYFICKMYIHNRILCIHISISIKVLYSFFGDG